jgi:hypothetical protein
MASSSSGAATSSDHSAGQPASTRFGASRRSSAASDLLSVHKEPVVALSVLDRGRAPTLANRYWRPVIAQSLSTNLRSK